MEAKRLKERDSVLMRAYIKEGMDRFISVKYPIGCMFNVTKIALLLLDCFVVPPRNDDTDITSLRACEAIQIRNKHNYFAILVTLAACWVIYLKAKQMKQ
jgi:hypothetical protein